MVHEGAPPPAVGSEVRYSFSIGEQAHGAYSVYTVETVVVPFPVSTRIARPKPSSVVFCHRPFTVAVCVGGLYVYA